MEFKYFCTEKDLDKALSIIGVQEQVLKEAECRDYFIYDLYLNKALYFHAVNDLEKLSEFAFKALKEAERAKNEEKLITALKEIVYLFTRMQESEKNWTYIKRVEKLVNDRMHPVQLTKHYRWLGYEYESAYTKTKRKTLIDSGLVYIKKAKKNALRYQIDYEVALIYRAMEAFSYHKGNPKAALRYIDSAIFYAKRIKGIKNLSGMYNSKAWDHLDLNQNAEAIKWMDTALYLDNKLAKGTAANMMMHYDAADLYESAGDLERAYKSFRIYGKTKDSILKQEKVKVINELETKYNTELKDAEIKNKRLQIVWLLVLVVLVSLVSFLIFFVYRQRSLKNKMKILETEQRLNRARINPHFFFNVMASLQSFAHKENSPKTSAYLSNFAKIMRQSLESTYSELVSIEKEIDFMTQYLEAQKLLYPNKFDYYIEFDNSLEINELKIPGMLLQPFLENAIEHGFKNIDYKGSVDIIFQERPKEIHIKITDNGKTAASNPGGKKYPSRAMEIIQDRLSLFNKQQKSKARYEVIDSNTARGFAIAIYLPKLY
ncbi:sensor histidine kinase [Flagellimonas sp.]|uniref:sensor histidine kinase n=1 Tax=Flagellimonas sp. TaxID=2058762 RepID=UPI003B512131